MYYRNTTDPSTLTSLLDLIERSPVPLHGFQPQLAVIVTYVNVSDYRDETLKHSAQMVLITDFMESFLVRNSIYTARTGEKF